MSVPSSAGDHSSSILPSNENMSEDIGHQDPGDASGLNADLLTGQNTFSQLMTPSASPNDYFDSVNGGLDLSRLTINSYENEVPAQHYDPDRDEVESQDGAGSNDDMNEPDENVVDGEAYLGNQNVQYGFEQDEESHAPEDVSMMDDSEDQNSDEESSIDLDHIGCNDECQQNLQRRYEQFNQRIQELQNQVRSLNNACNQKDARIQALQAEIQRKALGQSKTIRRWPTELRRHLENHPQALTYNKIYALCCKEENMSCKTLVVHPNLRLRRPTSAETEAAISHAFLASDSESEADEAEGHQNGERPVDHSPKPDEIFVREQEPNQHRQKSVGYQLSGDSHQPSNHFAFQQLPVNIRVNILKFTLVQEDKLIHCISRLDPFICPESPIEPDARKSGLLHRFHLSGASCNVSCAIKPNEHLRVLLVCKEWCFLGVHVFYGLNTFAFSSLGEFSSFCTGIGQARRERIQHIEMLWVGNQHLTFPRIYKGNSTQPKYTSRRTWACSLLCEMPQLKSLTIHINETGAGYIRRRHEPSQVIDYMASNTAGQPNFRLTRSLRTIQGLDYITQLRGMNFVRLFDFEMHLELGGRHVIRDWTFTRDVQEVTSHPKSVEKAEAAKLENLKPVLRQFEAHAGHLEAIKRYYETSRAFDTAHFSRPGTLSQYEETQSPIAEENVDDDIQMNAVQDLDFERGAAAKDEDKETAKLPLNIQKEADGSKTHDQFDSDFSAEGGEANPRVETPDDQSITTGTDLGTLGPDKLPEDEVSLAGSIASNPIDIEQYTPKFQEGWNHIKREDSVTSSNELFVRQNTYDTCFQSNQRNEMGRRDNLSPTPLYDLESFMGFDQESSALHKSPVQSLQHAQRGQCDLREGMGKRRCQDDQTPQSLESNVGSERNSDQMPLSTDHSYTGYSQTSSSRALPTDSTRFISSDPLTFFLRSGDNPDNDPNPFKKQRKQ
ncbi:uncharacterized protein CTRU02_210968 [Colletotrichum truncatum]|uniref:Uncharacterized protein n=1 Tax=Colletotrichum truncatum TaxID=5467 RepID=A0ACC3YQF8_COLTU|nr:uncharacterized protein CTRU02_03549 [Colletotrichum truncatum]KAF6796571.1 hypothetical protein CTRU02_03549 [Colletotrichum truncatum]